MKHFARTPLTLRMSLLLCVAAPAWGGAVEIDMEVRDLLDTGAPVEVGHLWIDGGKLRVEDPEGRGAMIFRGDEKVMIALDAKNKTYMRFDEEMLKQLGGALSEARRQMDERLASMPPEQRAMVEKMMAGSMPMATQQPATAKNVIEIEETNETRDIEGTSCQVTRLLRDGELQADVCVASFDDAGVSRSDLAVFKDLGSFYREVLAGLGPMAPDLGSSGFEIFDQLDGFPVSGREYKGGTAIRETRMRPKPGSSTAVLFEPPEGYTSRQPPIPSGAGR